MPGKPALDVAVLGGLQTSVRRTPGEGDPVVFVHGNPTFSFDWNPFMEQLARPAIAFDLPGFGASERPAADRFDFTMQAYAAWIGAALDELGLDRFGLVVHDWGAIALQPAGERADRVDRLAVIDAVPLFAGYRWHWVARAWRRPGLGEQLMAGNSKALFAAGLRLARPRRRPMPSEWLDQTWEAFDRGTREAVLGLYRSAQPEALAAAGAGLGRLDCPARVIWGARDPYIGTDWGGEYTAALPNARYVELRDAGHWPWIDEPELVGSVCDFLAAA